MLIQYNQDEPDKSSADGGDAFHVKQNGTRLLRVATYNIHGGKDTRGRASLPEIAEVLRGVNADIVFLQECDRFLPRSGFCDQAAFLARVLGLHRTFYGPLGVGAARFGNAVLTRQSPNAVCRLRLPASGGEPRGAVGARVGNVWAWATHLGLRDDWRQTQLAFLARTINETQTSAGKSPRPEPPSVTQAKIPTIQNYNKSAVVVGGDFNCLPDAAELHTFLANAGLFLVSPDAATFPAANPTARIDFLMARGLTPVAEAEEGKRSGGNGVVLSPASDHGLVWQDLKATTNEE